MKIPRLRLEALIKGLVAVALFANLALFLGGFVFARTGGGSGSPATPEELVALDREGRALEARLLALRTITTPEAVERVLGLDERAASVGARVEGLQNASRRERLGKREFPALVSTLELRGPRDGLIRLLQEIPTAFQENAWVTNVDARGSSDAFTIRLTLIQIVQA
ncbi:MAG: hypothetical protein HYX95_03585 [Chloroflexi bacterium]|nr:hypothetical protein [Chloroflexota bacterium]